MLAYFKKSLEKKDQGFTLIELLVVIVIIGILAAIAIPLFLSQREKGVDAGVKSDIKALATVEETIYTDKLAYSATATEVGAAGFKNTKGNVINVAVTTDGFCINGYNPAGGKDGAGNAFWYDSLAGGMIDAPAATSTTGACAGAPAGTKVSS